MPVLGYRKPVLPVVRTQSIVSFSRFTRFAGRARKFSQTNANLQQREAKRNETGNQSAQAGALKRNRRFFPDVGGGRAGEYGPFTREEYIVVFFSAPATECCGRNVDGDSFGFAALERNALEAAE